MELQPPNPQIHMVQQVGGPVITTQPVFTAVTTIVPQPASKPWSSGLCDCCNDFKSCCCAWWCGCIFYSCLAQRMGENCCIGYCGYSQGCVPGGHLAMRARFRGTHNIQGNICADCCAVTCCLGCVMCQLSREMDHLGYASNSC